MGAAALETAFDRLAAPRLDTELALERGRITLVVFDEGGTLRTIG